MARGVFKNIDAGTHPRAIKLEDLEWILIICIFQSFKWSLNDDT